MFRAYNINNNTLSLRNMILLFLTIVMGFGAVITLGQISIPSSISNARQTIAHVTITATGINTAPLIDMSGGGIFIDDTILTPETNFSGKVLGIDDAGNVIYVLSESLVVSGVGAGGGSELRDEAGDNVYRYTGNVGIGTATMSGKLHLLGSGTTELYIEETSSTNAANINFKTINNKWMVGAFDQRFYIGLNALAYLNITTGGFVGINIETPSVPLQINGNIIAGCSTNIITGTDSAIIGGGCDGENGHQISGDNSFIAGGKGHTLEGNGSAIIGGANKNYLIRSNEAFMLGGGNNELYDSNNATVAGGNANHIYGSFQAFIAGGDTNMITGSANSIIAGGNNNEIINAENSFVGGKNANISGYINTFVRNSATGNATTFSAGKAASFLINVPGGMGINTPNPQAALDVSGDIRSNSLQLSPSSIVLGTCTTPGVIIYKNSHFYGCNNINRIQLDNL